MINNEYTEPHAGFNDEDKENVLNNEAPGPTMESEASQKQDAGNSAKRAAGVAAATLAGAASATAAGTYYIHNQEAAEEETDNATPKQRLWRQHILPTLPIPSPNLSLNLSPNLSPNLSQSLSQSLNQSQLLNLILSTQKSLRWKSWELK